MVLISGGGAKNGLEQHFNVVDAAKKAGVKCLAYTRRCLKDRNTLEVFIVKILNSFILKKRTNSFVFGSFLVEAKGKLRLAHNFLSNFCVLFIRLFGFFQTSLHVLHGLVQSRFTGIAFHCSKCSYPVMQGELAAGNNTQIA